MNSINMEKEMEMNELELNELEAAAGGAGFDEFWDAIMENPAVKKIKETAKDVADKVGNAANTVKTTVNQVADHAEHIGEMVWNHPGTIIEIFKN